MQDNNDRVLLFAALFALVCCVVVLAPMMHYALTRSLFSPFFLNEMSDFDRAIMIFPDFDRHQVPGLGGYASRRMPFMGLIHIALLYSALAWLMALAFKKGAWSRPRARLVLIGLLLLLVNPIVNVCYLATTDEEIPRTVWVMRCQIIAMSTLLIVLLRYVIRLMKMRDHAR